jgi:hypothetical protein
LVRTSDKYGPKPAQSKNEIMTLIIHLHQLFYRGFAVVYENSLHPLLEKGLLHQRANTFNDRLKENSQMPDTKHRWVINFLEIVFQE